MPSEHRLHPSSIFFRLGSQLREFVVPALLVLVSASSAGVAWQVWTLWLIIPYALVAIARYASFRYRYEASEIVIRTGFLFRNERHVPYARIQNLDAAQNVLHRMFGVVEVRVETGGGQEPEATLSVLPVADFEAMRRRVFLEKGRPIDQAGLSDASSASPAASAPAPETGRVVLKLAPRDLLLFGFIQNRGIVVVAAAMGLLWEIGLWDRLVDYLFARRGPGGRVARDLVGGWLGGGAVPVAGVLLALGALAAILLMIRVLSMGWTLIRLHGFTLTRSGEDLRTEYGVLTRVTATIPLRRIQTLTIREGSLHRVFDRVSVRVATAGGNAVEGNSKPREWLAPIIGRSMLPDLVREVLPGFDLAPVDWRAADPGAFRRVFKRSAAVAALVSVPFVGPLGWWVIALLVTFLLWARLHARLYVKYLGWALTDDAVLFRSGWWWRHVTVARFERIQAVALHESPFDRRASMARVRVDTAGGGDASHRVDIPYLPRETARALAGMLATQAGRTAFRW
jgi:putative membrane protein